MRTKRGAACPRLLAAADHVLLRRVGWFWFELPARASCAEREKKRAIVAFEVGRF